MNRFVRLLQVQHSHEYVPAGEAASSSGAVAGGNAEDQAWAQAYLERMDTAMSSGAIEKADDAGYTGEGWSDEALGQMFWEVNRNADEVMVMETAVLVDFISFPSGSGSTKKKKKGI